jgi:hypothetical protein
MLGGGGRVSIEQEVPRMSSGMETKMTRMSSRLEIRTVEEKTRRGRGEHDDGKDEEGGRSLAAKKTLSQNTAAHGGDRPAEIRPTGDIA